MNLSNFVLALATVLLFVLENKYKTKAAACGAASFPLRRKATRDAAGSWVPSSRQVPAVPWLCWCGHLARQLQGQPLRCPVLLLRLQVSLELCKRRAGRRKGDEGGCRLHAQTPAPSRPGAAPSGAPLDAPVQPGIGRGNELGKLSTGCRMVTRSVLNTAFVIFFFF